ncbi:MAG: methyltransferase domain-containing protein [Verrucomicrobia subdivision 3 bacterium]|nr:methyltransferase domain-containing protein [Limisphaerales bacterium]
MKTFRRSDGAHLQVVEGFRNRILSYRDSVSPRAAWQAEDYRAAADKKRRRFNRLISQIRQWVPSFDQKRVLDIGCGDGTNTLLFGREPVRAAIGIDLFLPLFSRDPVHSRTRAFIKELLHGAPMPESSRFLIMDATQLSFCDAAFDLVVSRSAMEHIKPIERALAEICRVAEPGALIYLGIDPFYWVRGCHKRGVTDIPFAHARLSLDDYERFVTEHEGPDIATRRRRRLETLNRLTVGQWRDAISELPCNLLLWSEKQSDIGGNVLSEFPEIAATLLPGTSTADLMCERIEVWLRRR